MVKRILLLFALTLPICARAYNVPITDTLRWKSLACWEDWAEPLEPVYLKDVVLVSPWQGNWFMNVSGGASAFIGSPIGCGDLFDRMKPALSVSLGKWFTPAIGARATFQGIQFKDAALDTHGFQHLHADLLWNMLSGMRSFKDDFRWDLVPYIGLGVVHHEGNGSHPFALSYGLQGRYRLNRRLHLTAELSGMSTFKDFDGLGASNKWGDRMLTLSVGLSVTIGKKGWKRVIDATPYIDRSERLAGYTRVLNQENELLLQKDKRNARIIAELEKILKLEGLLDKYAGRLSSLQENPDSKIASGSYPRNDYSGLNSLRARLRNTKKQIGQDANDTIFSPVMDSLLINQPAGSEACLTHLNMANDSVIFRMISEDRYVGAPIYFFFALDTDRLTERSQLINLDGIARVAQKHGLYIQVSGAADSATGNATINTGLSQKRAAYIAEQLVKRGVSANRIKVRSEGGIDDYSPTEANRNACVKLLLPPQDTAD